MRYTSKYNKRPQFTGLEFHVDHRHPVAPGGSSLASSLQLLPGALNLRKGDLPYDDALATVEGYAAWVNSQPTYEQVSHITRHPNQG
jgi:hypothetical protein